MILYIYSVIKNNSALNHCVRVWMSVGVPAEGTMEGTVKGMWQRVEVAWRRVEARGGGPCLLEKRINNHNFPLFCGGRVEGAWEVRGGCAGARGWCAAARGGCVVGAWGARRCVWL